MARRSKEPNQQLATLIVEAGFSSKASRGESSIWGGCADTGISSTTTAPLSDGCAESSLVPRRQSY